MLLFNLDNKIRPQRLIYNVKMWKCDKCGNERRAKRNIPSYTLPLAAGSNSHTSTFITFSHYIHRLSKSITTLSVVGWL